MVHADIVWGAFVNRQWQLATGLTLTALAGYVDALGFVRLGGLYTSFMSGNITQLAVLTGELETMHLWLPLALIGSFLFGAILGSLVAILIGDRWATPAVLTVEAGLVAGALVIGLVAPEPGWASFALATAMGAQNAVLSRVKGFRAGTTFVTGALFGFGQKIAEAITRKGPPFAWAGDGLVWLSLFVGALCGALAYQALNLYALIAPALVAAVLALITSLLVARERPAAKVAS